MADFIRIRHNDQNEYRVQIRVEGYIFDVLIDTGLTNPDCLVGVGLDNESYHAVRPYLRYLHDIAMEGVGGREPDWVLGGLGRVRIEGLDGSEVETYVAEAGDNLLGVCYFHRLPGYELIWDLEAGEITIRKKGR